MEEVHRRLAKMKDSHKRSLLKSISWRLMATFISLIIVFAATGDYVITGIVGILDFTIKLVAYYIHERLWT